MRKHLLLLLVSTMFPLGAQETLFNHVPDPRSKTRVEAVALFNQPAPGGYLPVRVTVTNTSESEGRINLSTESSDAGYNNMGSKLTSSFSLTIPPEKTTIHDILVPCTTLLNDASYGRGSNLTVNVRMSGSFGGAYGSISGSYGENQSAVLLSEPLYTPNASALDSHMSSSGSSRYGSSTFAGKFDPRSLPEDWRAYSGYDVVAMTDTDWGNTTPGVRTAILRWNRLGGELVIYATSSAADLASLRIEEDARGIHKADRSFGRAEVIPIDSSLKLEEVATIARLTSGLRLFPANQSIRADFSGAWPLQKEFGEQGYNYALFILILIAFGILVGPVNLFVFAKSGRRHRLFITTPLIALGTSVLLIALIVIIDGFGGRGMRAVLMEVRPGDGENSAYVLQEQISRTGVLLGGGFTLDEPAAFTAVPLASSQWARLTTTNHGGGMRYQADFKDGKLDVDGDWFQSRSEQGHLLRVVVPTRGRIESRGTTGPPSFLSTFDFEIGTLYYLDDSQGWWKAENVSPGKAFTCTNATGEEASGFIRDTKATLSARSGYAFSTLTSRPGHFIAITDDAPGIATLKGIKWSQTRTVITGPIAKP